MLLWKMQINTGVMGHLVCIQNLPLNHNEVGSYVKEFFGPSKTVQRDKNKPIGQT